MQKILPFVAVGALAALLLLPEISRRQVAAKKQDNARRSAERIGEKIKQESSGVELYSDDELDALSVKVIDGERVAILDSPAFYRAAMRAGVPSSWADFSTDDGKNIAEILTRETDLRMDRKNGEFESIGQVSRNVWRRFGDGSDSPRGKSLVKQLVAVFKYIKERYKTTQAALAFHDAHSAY